MFARTTRRRVSADTATAASFYTIVETIKVRGRLRKSLLRKKKTSEASPGRASVSMALGMWFLICCAQTLMKKAMKKKSCSRKNEQFACTICHGPFSNALETICGHYFCETWALKQFKKSSRCTLNAPTKLRKQCADNTNAVVETSTKDNHKLRQNLK
ncbi:hypothetical protein PsorP6_005845 [Peronosclerospora sorghi]|uniref:Uncharacterized protein n=1 Tax=Peronosclerospora sorghi TaxID=230839 RepID=A0ACC0W5L1_9STRA|nr:hypothetical protein PsorP6_005845 [Peronosclerospora sorghi]